MCAAMPIAAIKMKDIRPLFGLVPYGFIIAFQYDRLYGNMPLRVREEAARLIKEEPERFYPIEGNGMCS